MVSFCLKHLSTYRMTGHVCLFARVCAYACVGVYVYMCLRVRICIHVWILDSVPKVGSVVYISIVMFLMFGDWRACVCECFVELKMKNKADGYVFSLVTKEFAHGRRARKTPDSKYVCMWCT